VEFLEFLFPPLLGEAEIRVLNGSDTGRILRVSFVLKTLELAKQNDFDVVSAPGLNGEPLRFVRGRARTLTMVLHFDGRATNTDVRQPIGDVTNLMNVDRDTHAPPVLSFEWTGFSLHCVLERSTVRSFSALLPDGRPSRGRIDVIFRESKTLEELLLEARRE
jgi:contractile injection system tube protein